MLIDKNGKIGGKLNIIDLLTVLVIIIAIAGISFRYFSAPSQNAREKVKLVFTVDVEDLREYTVDALSKKGKVIEPKKKNYIGVITDVESRNYTKDEFDSDGNLVHAEVPDKYSVTVTIEAEGKESENGYFVGNDTELSVGSTIFIATKYLNTSGKVKNIKVLK